MHTRIIFVFTALALIALSVAAAPARTAVAQGGITVQRQDASYKFSEEIVFELDASSGSDITDVVLLYEEGHAETVNRRQPEFTAGPQVTARVTERLERGEIPPGTEIKYHWQIKDAAGNVLTTEPQTLLYMDDRFEFDSLTEGKLTVYWHGADRGFGQRVMDSATKALARLEDSVGVQLEEPVRIVVYQTKDDMLEALPERGTVFDDRVTTLGIVRPPATILLLGQQPDLDATIAHELTHVVIRLATDNPFGGIPTWLNEGLAMWNESEGVLRGSNRDALDQAIAQDRLLSIHSLTAPTGNPTEVNLWYGEVFSVVDYLLKAYGPEKMADLLATFKKGAAYDDALTKVYGFDQDELDARWRESLGLAPRAAAATAQPTPATGGQPATQSRPTPAPAVPPQPETQAPGASNWAILLAALMCCGVFVVLALVSGVVGYLVFGRRS